MDPTIPQDISDTSAMTQALFGVNAVHVPAWLYVQNAGPGAVTFVGASRIGQLPHPLRYGSERIHQFVVGELVVRPHVVTATDVLRGNGLASLALGGEHDTALAGDVLVDQGGRLAGLRAGASS